MREVINVKSMYPINQIKDKICQQIIEMEGQTRDTYWICSTSPYYSVAGEISFHDDLLIRRQYIELSYQHILDQRS